MGFFARLTGRSRRPDLPGDVRALLRIAPRERVLAWVELVGGGYAAALVERLVVLDPRGRLVARPWVDVDHAAWDDESQTLAVWWVGSRAPLALEVGDTSFLPEVVHERVRASVVLTREVEVPGGRRVHVALRKSPRGDLSTSVSPGRGVRLTDPEVQVLVAAAETALRDEAGLLPLTDDSALSDGVQPDSLRLDSVRLDNVRVDSVQPDSVQLDVELPDGAAPQEPGRSG